MAVVQVQIPTATPTSDLSTSYQAQNALLELLALGTNDIQVQGTFPNLQIARGSTFETNRRILTTDADTALPACPVPAQNRCMVLFCKDENNFMWAENTFGSYNAISRSYYNEFTANEHYRCLDVCVRRLKTSDTTFVISKVQDVDVGHLYMRLPNMPPPSGAGYRGVWNNISSEYAGLFFRVEGGNADAYDTTDAQKYATIRLNGEFVSWQRGSFNPTNMFFVTSEFHNTTRRVDTTGSDTSGDITGFDNQRTLGTDHIANEIRPINKTIQIYRRVS